MSNIKNPLFQKDIRNKIKSTDYVDSENPNIPKQKKNPPFFQFYKGASFEFLKEKMQENSKAMAVWFELVSLMDNQGAVMISQNSLAEFFNVTPRTIRNWIDWLDDNDMISIFKIGTANVYAINSAIVSDRLVTEKQNFALFNARVVADKKEQTKKIKQKFFSVADTISNNNQLDLIEQIKEIETTK
ncbi:hypothetical protein [Empedobacter falsenii]